jgi:hypothetical protein
LLLDSIIDYAGLFPPAGLDMRAAVREYAQYRAGEYARMLGRFIVPVSRLREFELQACQHAESVVQQGVTVGEPWQSKWPVSVLAAAADLSSDVAAIVDFSIRHPSPQPYGNVLRDSEDSLGPRGEGRGAGVRGPSFAIDTIELKATAPDQIIQAMQHVPPGLCAYFEVPISSEPLLLSTACEAGARVKVRTGGVTPQAFPTCDELAGFLVRCAAARVPFKATAGLHHPIRSLQRLTYEIDSPHGTMHGFLNVFLAAVGVCGGMSTEQASRLLDEMSPSAFQFSELGASWAGQYWANDNLHATRQQFAISFGSCSFQEPIDDLKAIGLLSQ